MFRHRRDYYQIYRVDHRRNHEQMIAEVESPQPAEKMVAQYLRDRTPSEIRDEISYYRSTFPSSVPKMLRAS